MAAVYRPALKPAMILSDVCFRNVWLAAKLSDNSSAFRPSGATK
jgi:hypothetical protein